MEQVAQNYSPVIVDLTSGMRRAQDGTHVFYRKLGYCNDGVSEKLYLRKEF